MTDRKLNLDINLGEIRYLEVTDYKLKFITWKFETMDAIWWTEIIEIHLDEIHHTEVFAVADAKTTENLVL